MAGTDAAGLNLDDLGRFTTTIAAGEFVYREGDAGADVFIIQDGRVDLLVAGDERSVASIESGGIFGEAALFGAAPRDVSARAATDVRLIRLDRAAFDRIVTEAPQVAVAMLQQVARHAAGLRAQVQTAARLPVEAVASATAGVDEPSLVAADADVEFPLAGLDVAIVGRRDANAGFVPEIDLTPLDGQRTLSRQHAKLERRGTSVFVCQAKGRNGTFVNGTRLAADDEVEVREGDRVQFGVVAMVFRRTHRGARP